MNEQNPELPVLRRVLTNCLEKLGVTRAAVKGDQWRYTPQNLGEDLADLLLPQLSDKALEHLVDQTATPPSPVVEAQNLANIAKVETTIATLDYLLVYLKAGQPKEPQQP